jgi:NTP pyrophosphatase (non-canonical NTP hydrolase)
MVARYTRRMSFAPIQKSVDDWIQQKTQGYFQPLQMVARMTEELGEVSRAVSYRFGEKVPKPGEDRGDVADELCDLIFVCVCLANSLGIDLDEAWTGLLTKLYQRDATRYQA